MKSKQKYLALILLLSTLLGVAQSRTMLKTEEIDKITQFLNTATQNITSIQADFNQEKAISFMEDKLMAQGKFWFSSPDKIRWEYLKPYPYLVIMNNGKMSVTDETDSYSMDMRSNQIFQQMNALITASIQGQLLTNKLDYTKEYFSEKEFYVVCFYPKNQQMKDYLTAIELYFSKDNGKVSALKMLEAAGDYTFIRFFNRIENIKMEASVFNLTKNTK
jgi:outer membrane lipoprotein carrier protein